MGKFGTVEWVRKTGGVLSWQNKMQMILSGLYSSQLTKQRIKAGVKIRNLEVDEILPPDSPIAKEASRLCEDASGDYLFNHSVRSYYWARLLTDPSVKFDDEALFVSFMLHDLGLCEQYRKRLPSEQCFTIVGARKVEELAAHFDWSDKRAAVAANAITLHLNVTVRASHGSEARMVRLGSGADVAGLGLDVLQQDQIETVISKYPRLDLKKQILTDLKLEMEANPCCRIAFMQQKLGFRGLVRNSLFRD